MRLQTVLVLVLFYVSIRLDQVSGSILQHSETPLTEEEKQILVDCENPDYRTYIKCLKRHKRHHGLSGESKKCMEDCLDANCSTLACNNECLVKCKRKIKYEELYSKTIEVDCVSDNCPNKSNIHNIDTTVNVNNSLGFNLTSLIDIMKPKIEISNVINNGNKDGSGRPYDTPNLFSMSMSMAGFGSWPIFMPSVIPFPVMQNQMPNVNCSLCGSLIFKYRCDISCTNVANSTESPKTDRPLINPLRCRSPSCVGGS